MNCRVCGRAIGGGMLFCSRCGTRVSLEPPAFESTAATPPRVGRAGSIETRAEQHRQLLGVLWCVDGALHLLGMVVLFLVLGLPLHFVNFNGVSAWPWSALLLAFLMVVLGVASLLALAAGYGLLTRKSWGRTTALITAVLSLIHPPLGTVLGVYTLWALLPGRNESPPARMER